MPEIPRDPRQLARDILSGKVRIEDLARERQARQGGQGANVPARPMPPAARVPDRIPLPRQTPVQRPPVISPNRAPVPARSPTQRQPAQPASRQTPVRAPARPAPPPPMPATAFPPPPARLPAPARPTVSSPATAQAAALQPPGTAPRPATPTRIQDLVRSKKALRQGVLLAEILAKPLALREENLF